MKKKSTIRHHRGELPGKWITLGYTWLYLSIIVLLPLSTLFISLTETGFQGIWREIARPRVIKALEISISCAGAAALINTLFGSVYAWVLVRYTFPAKNFLNAAIDLPFALPTAVAGISLTAVYAPTGWLGSILAPFGIQVAFTPLGIVIALIFVGLPFVVRTLQPVMENLDREMEEAAATLGASRWQTLGRVVLPSLLPTMMTGFTLAFARGIGEYGSVVFISGNRPMHTEIAPLLIVTQLEQYNFAGANAIAMALLFLSFLCLLMVNILQHWSAKRLGPTT